MKSHQIWFKIKQCCSIQPSQNDNESKIQAWPALYGPQTFGCQQSIHHGLPEITQQWLPKSVQQQTLLVVVCIVHQCCSITEGFANLVKLHFALKVLNHTQKLLPPLCMQQEAWKQDHALYVKGIRVFYNLFLEPPHKLLVAGTFSLTWPTPTALLCVIWHSCALRAHNVCWLFTASVDILFQNDQVCWVIRLKDGNL